MVSWECPCLEQQFQHTVVVLDISQALIQLSLFIYDISHIISYVHMAQPLINTNTPRGYIHNVHILALYSTQNCDFNNLKIF